MDDALATKFVNIEKRTGKSAPAAWIRRACDRAG
jgi:hypothetical protein